MALKLNLVSKPIEIEVNGLEFQVSKDDGTVNKLDEIMETVVNKFQNEEDKQNANLDELREVLINACDSLLGQGAYEKIEQSIGDGEYTVMMMGVVTQVINGIREELFEDANVLDKYKK